MTIMTRCKNVKYYFYYCDDDDDDGIMMIMIILLNFESISRISFIIIADHKIMVYKYPMSWLVMIIIIQRPDVDVIFSYFLYWQ